MCHHLAITNGIPTVTGEPKTQRQDKQKRQTKKEKKKHQGIKSDDSDRQNLCYVGSEDEIPLPAHTHTTSTSSTISSVLPLAYSIVEEMIHSPPPIAAPTPALHPTTQQEPATSTTTTTTTAPRETRESLMAIKYWILTGFSTTS
jgi:hypothetical protein